jgi:hypothetical protein
MYGRAGFDLLRARVLPYSPAAIADRRDSCIRIAEQPILECCNQKHRRVPRQVDLKPDHVGGLAFAIWIIRGHLTLEPGFGSALSGISVSYLHLSYGSIRVCAGAGPRYRYDRLDQPPHTALNAVNMDFAHAAPLMMSWSCILITFSQKYPGARQK